MNRQGGPIATASIALLLAVLGGCSEDALDPSLQAVLPDHGAPGAVVDVLGERLEGSALQVNIGGQSAELVLRETRRLRLRVPAVAPGQQLLVVSVEGRVSNALPFTVEGRLDASP